MHQLAHRAYGETTHRTANARQIEFQLFQQITNQLELVASTQDPSPAVWADALERNRQLWSIIAIDLMAPENDTAAELKAGLIGISEFVRRTTLTVLSGGEGLQDLIEINQSIMAGLAGNIAPQSDLEVA